MVRKTGMKIRLEIDRHGDLTMTPVAEYWQNKIRQYLSSWGVEWGGSVLSVNIDDDLYWFDLTSTERQDLDRGWPVVKLIDPWRFGQGYVGYDAGDRNYQPLD